MKKTLIILIMASMMMPVVNAQPTPLGNEVSELIYGEGAFLGIAIMILITSIISALGSWASFFAGLVNIFYGIDIVNNMDPAQFHIWAGVFVIFVGLFQLTNGWKGQ